MRENRITILENKIDFLTREVEDLKQEFRDFLFQNLQQEDIIDEDEDDT